MRHGRIGANRASALCRAWTGTRQMSHPSGAGRSVPSRQADPRRSAVTTFIVVVFLLVYLGMILGGLPFLQLDRTGIALLGAMALVGSGAVSPDDAARSLHLPTLLLLFSFMVISAQMRLGGFYDWVTRRLAALPLTPPLLLGALILVV